MKTIIWDFNGTILDDTALCLKIENDMLEERGMKHGYTIEEYRDLFCFPVIDYYYKIGYTFETESYEEISEQFHKRYRTEFHTCGLNEGFQSKIQESCDKGYRNVIISASKQEILEEQCQLLHITDYFEDIVGIQDKLAYSKIDAALQWMHHKQVHPEECKFIGDSGHDYETALALGIKDIVLVACGHQSKKQLLQNHAIICDTLLDIEL